MNVCHFVIKSYFITYLLSQSARQYNTPSCLSAYLLATRSSATSETARDADNHNARPSQTDGRLLTNRETAIQRH